MSVRHRSRSPQNRNIIAPSLEKREKVLAEFAQLFWLRPDADGDQPPWVGQRAKSIEAFRARLVIQVQQAVEGCDDGITAAHHFREPTEEDLHRWRKFTFFEDVVRMSDVLFRGPIDCGHADDIDLQLHHALARIQRIIPDWDVFGDAVQEYRVSSVHIAMLLETSRPPEVIAEGDHELPDARTLAGLMSLRCEKDDPEELIEIYRLVCSKLRGIACPECGGPLDEHSSCGMFDAGEALVVPVTVPKVFVPHCGHAIHTLCFGQMLIPADAPFRGRCRACGDPFFWNTIDIDPMVNAFCLLFAEYVEKKIVDSEAVGEVPRSAVMSIALFCRNFSDEMGGLVSPTSAWLLLARRSGLERTALGDLVMSVLLPPEPDEAPKSRLDDALSDIEEQEEHITDVYLDPDLPDLEEVEPRPEDDFIDQPAEPPMNLSDLPAL